MVRIVIKSDKLAVDFPKHIAYTYDRAGARKAQVPITEFLIFLKGSELNMKFTKGYWMNLPGVTNTDAVQVR